METVNRGWLKRQVEKGHVLAKCEYRYTDDYRYDAACNFGEMPGYVQAWLAKENDYSNHIEGKLKLWDFYFNSKSGCAYKNNDGTITLNVHSNLSYTLRIL